MPSLQLPSFDRLLTYVRRNQIPTATWELINLDDDLALYLDFPTAMNTGKTPALASFRFVKDGALITFDSRNWVNSTKLRFVRDMSSGPSTLLEIGQGIYDADYEYSGGRQHEPHWMVPATEIV